MASKAPKPIPTEEQQAKAPIYTLESIPREVEIKDEEDEEKPEGGLPPPPTLEDVKNIGELVNESFVHAKLKAAHLKLSHGHRETAVHWDVVLYNLMCAWVVNYGRDPKDVTGTKQATPSEIEVPDLTTGADYARQNDELVHLAAKHLNLKWIPFVDLALAPFSAANKPQSGPYAGVFVHEGAEPFLVLAFKGTTFGMEVTTDALASAVKVATPSGALYNALTHLGMARGLFTPFTHTGYSKATFDLIHTRLGAIAQTLNRPGLPVYVTGHSLGAGYATQAHVELIRRTTATPSPHYTIHDLYVYGSPRMFNNGSNPLGPIPGQIGIREVQNALNAANVKVWRVANYKDLVPNFPRADLTGHLYKHLDKGFKTFPDPADVDKLVEDRPTEVGPGNPEDNDGYPGPGDVENWKWHWPPRYFEAVVKVLKNHHKI